MILRMIATEIKNMTNHERLTMMESLWDAICHDQEEPASPTWHKPILEKRKEKLDSGEAKFQTLDEVRAQYSS